MKIKLRRDESQGYIYVGKTGELHRDSRFGHDFTQEEADRFMKTMADYPGWIAEIEETAEEFANRAQAPPRRNLS